MAVKVADTVKPLAEFFVAEGEDVSLVRTDGSSKSLQAMYNDGEIGSDGVKVDTEMSDESVHPVQNKVIKEYVDGYAGLIDSVYDSNRNTLILKGARGSQGGGGTGTTDYNDLINKPQIGNTILEGIKTIRELDLVSTDENNSLRIGKDGKLFTTGGGGLVELDEVMSDDSKNAVQNKAIKKYVDDSQPEVDSQMSDASENLVQNKVIKGYVDEFAGKFDTEYDANRNALIFKRARSIGAELSADRATGDTFDGKPVYEIYMKVTSPTSSTGNIDASQLNIGTILDLNITIAQSNDNVIAGGFRGNGLNIYYNGSTKQFVVEVGSTSVSGGRPSIIYCKYTKKD